jgi:hypothetical protein
MNDLFRYSLFNYFFICDFFHLLNYFKKANEKFEPLLLPSHNFPANAFPSTACVNRSQHRPAATS